MNWIPNDSLSTVQYFKFDFMTLMWLTYIMCSTFRILHLINHYAFFSFY